MATAEQIYASQGISPDPDVVVSLDAQFDKLDHLEHNSHLIVTGVSVTLYAKFTPDGPLGKTLFDKPGVDLFYSTEPVPKLPPGTYKLDILAAEKAFLYKGDKLLWAGKSVKNFNNLAGTHEITFN